MPSRPEPVAAAQRTARPRSRSRAAKAAAKAGEAVALEAIGAPPPGSAPAAPASACGLAAAAGSISPSQATPVEAAATRCSRRLMPMPITATRPAPRATVSISTPPSLRPGSAAADEPEVVGPLQADAKRGAGLRIERLGEGDADREREPREVDAGSERPGQREGERRARRRLPGSPEAAPAGGLPLGDEGARCEHAVGGCLAGPGQQVGVGRGGLVDPLDLDRRRPARVHFPFGASMVPRHLRLPQRQANCFFTFLVCRPSRTRP